MRLYAIPASWLRPQLTPNQLLVLVALFVAATQNLSFWREVMDLLPEDRGMQEYAFMAGLSVVLCSWLLILLLPFSVPPLLKPSLILTVLVAAVCGYFMDSFHVVIDEVMITNTAQTDLSETAELLGFRFFLRLLWAGVIPAVLIHRARLRPGTPGREALHRAALAAVALVTLLGAVLLNYKSFSLWVRDHRELRMYANPSYPLYSAYRHIAHWAHGAGAAPLTPLGEDAALAPRGTGRRRAVVLVVGEAARAASFQLNGYARATNPQLSKVGGLINFPRMYSCGTSTAVSLPCMFSRQGRERFSRRRAQSQENLLDVLQRAGVNVRWQDANSGCKGVCARVPTDNLRTTQNCGVGDCFDEILLHGLDELLGAGGRNQFIVLHQQGSHGPAYYKRYPPTYRQFIPECAQDQVQTCPRQDIVNTYDNSVLYTDQILARVIDVLKARERELDSVMIYASDHGESLGENGLYLHGFPYAIAPDEQKHIPMVVWFSASAMDEQRLDPGCAAATGRGRYSHDNLFDTALGLAGVSTSIYRSSGDIFAVCRREPRG